MLAAGAGAERLHIFHGILRRPLGMKSYLAWRGLCPWLQIFISSFLAGSAELRTDIGAKMFSAPELFCSKTASSHSMMVLRSIIKALSLHAKSVFV